MSRLVGLAATALLAAGCANLVNTLGIEDQTQKLKDEGAKISAKTSAFSDENCRTPEQLKPYALNAQNEYWFGRSVAARLLARYPGKIHDPTEPAVVYLNEVGQTAVGGALLDRDEGDGTPAHPRSFPAWIRRDATADRPMPIRGYQFILVKDPAPGAWSTPGGFVVVTDGLLARVANEDQLAAVLAHEVAHVQRGHGVQAVQVAMCKQGGFTDLMPGSGPKLNIDSPALKAKLAKAVGDVADKVMDTLINRGYDVGYEYEADAYGTRYLAAAGYSASALDDFLNSVRTDADFSTANSKTHPPADKRAHFIEEQLDHEKFDPLHSPHEPKRTPRFLKALAAAGLKPTGAVVMPKG